MLKQKLGLKDSPVFLIDGSSYLYRSFYAYRNLSRSDGFPTNVIFIVIRLILKILKQERPKYLGFFVDGKGPTFRNELSSEYKANRLKMPEDLAVQIEPLLTGLNYLGLFAKVTQGIEADDCIASVSTRLAPKRPVIIVGSDKDLWQLLQPNVFIWDPTRKSDQLLTADDFKQKWGFDPKAWPDFQALIGDSSDNIKGVPGIGPKTAQKIFKQIRSLEELETNLDRLNLKDRKKIEPELKNVYLYRELTRLKTDVCPEVNLNDLKVKKIDLKKFKDFCLEYEFNSLLQEVQELTSPELPLDKAKDVSLPPTQTITLSDPSKLSSSLQTEIGLVQEKKVLYLSDGQTEVKVLFDFKTLMEHVGQKIIFCPELKTWLQKDLSLLTRAKQWYDLGLASYLLDPEQRDYTFATLKKRFVQEIGKELTGIAQPALELGKHLLTLLRNAELEKLLLELEQPLTRVLVLMEKRGILIDQKKFIKFLDLVQDELKDLTQKIYKLAGQEFNIRSSQQLSQILFEKLKLKPTKKTPTGFYSTAESELEKIRQHHPLVELILKYRTLEKLRSTYLVPLLEKADPQGRIHTTFNQLATATGRLSSSNPNLQNIPVRGEYGPKMRACFIAPKDCFLISADYSQIELRVLAHFSEDPHLLAAFEQDLDIHTATASLIFNKDQKQITSEDRRKAKTINFGLLYGMGPQKLARELGISLKEAKDFIQKYFANFSQVHKFYQQVEQFAKEHGFVTTVLGRRRLLPQIWSQNQQMAAQAKRMAINTVIQGSAADLIKKAMLVIEDDPQLRSWQARQILQIHDELLLEVPVKSVEPAVARVREIMEGIYPLKVKLKVDIGYGLNWDVAHSS